MCSLNVEILEKNQYALKLYIRDLPLHVLNAIRRTVISEVPVMAIDYVIFIENSSVFYDEYIAHRLGLIPLDSENAYDKYKSPEECMEAGEKRTFSTDCFAKFDLEAEGLENGMLTIYSGDLVPSDPDIKPVFDKIPLAKLVKGQRIKLEAFARLGRGREHIKWSPVSVATHKYVPKIIVNDNCNGCGKCIDVCPRGLLKLSDGKVSVDKSRELSCNFCRLCEQVCELRAIKVSHKENEYILYFEFTGALSPRKTLVEASNILIKKLDEFEEKLKNLGVIQ
ncbi:MAG: DNA-directed RNA polymerase subunit D [Desulfurococcaceae archaeon]